MTRWFRFYDEALNDPKILKLSDNLHRIWVGLLCVASKNEGRLPALDDLALLLRIKPGKMQAALESLIKSGLFDDDGVMTKPHNWDGRQFKSDVSTERVKRFRSGKASVTATPPETEQIQNRAEADTRDELKTRVGDFRQAIVRAYAEANSPTLPETSRAELWITQGYQEDICLAVIAGIVRKRPNVAALSYFDGAIAEAHAKKAPPRKAINGHAPLDWDAIFTSYKKFGHWSRDAGNDPLSPNCRAPPDILRKYGFEPMGTA